MAGDATQKEALSGSEAKGDLESLVEHIKTHPTQYALSVGFIVLCAIASYFYQVQTSLTDRESATGLASALDIEDPVERAETLAAFTASPSKFTPDGLYVQGESYFRAQEYANAAAAFQQLRAEYPDFRFVPDAVEGLGFIEEENGNFEGALARYREVLDKWPDSFAGYRQPYNIGRCEERIGNIEKAIAAYRQQVELFPGSNISSRAQHSLHTLERAHPDIFERLNKAQSESALDVSLIEALDTLLENE
ncbi:MAG: tetratricopeptide repeat protein [Candidatus Hydrogenedentes bacterium]|nr:tetratricopeptide repeat protein [Candidatus Hydrogenedentota bacterium]